MGCVEGLHNPMIWKIATEASVKTRVKAIDKTSTHTDRILPLAREWAGSVKKLLIISLDQTGHCVAVLIAVHLVDVIQCGVGLAAVARA